MCVCIRIYKYSNTILPCCETLKADNDDNDDDGGSMRGWFWVGSATGARSGQTPHVCYRRVRVRAICFGSRFIWLICGGWYVAGIV